MTPRTPVELVELARLLGPTSHVSEQALFFGYRNAGPRACRECGCTDDRACPGGCWWVAIDLCSACADEDEG